MACGFSPKGELCAPGATIVSQRTLFPKAIPRRPARAGSFGDGLPRSTDQPVGKQAHQPLAASQRGALSSAGNSRPGAGAVIRIVHL